MKSLSTYINNLSKIAPTGKTMKGFFSNVGGDPIKRTIDIIDKLRNIKDYRSNTDYCLNLCMQFPVDFGMHIYSRDKQYQLHYIKNKKGEFDWTEKDSSEYGELYNSASTSAINFAKSLYIVFSGDYIVKPCFRDKNNKFEDL